MPITIDGGPGDDDILGTSEDERIRGLAGNDTLRGGGGNDTLLGGDGADTHYADEGDDVLDGGAGDDLYHLGGYYDWESGVPDQVVEAAGGGIDTAIADFDVTLAANVENLTLSNERIEIDRQTWIWAIRGTGNEQDNRILGNDFANRLSGLGGADRIDGDDGDDVLSGGAGRDTLRGGGGNDTLAGGGGTDLLDGGDGSDTVSYADDVAPVRVDLGRLEVSFIGETWAPEALVSFESAEGGSGDDELIGSGGENLLRGSGGKDRLRGGGGDDLLDGGGGQDSIDGGDGRDTVLYSDATVGVRVDLEAGTASFPGSAFLPEQLQRIENAEGGGAADRLAGNSGANVLRGLDGADVIEGRDGADRLQGGRGADELAGGAGGDVLNGNAGSNALSGGRGDDVLRSGHEFVWGWSDTDYYFSTTLDIERAVADTLAGGRGDDTYVLTCVVEGWYTSDPDDYEGSPTHAAYGDAVWLIADAAPYSILVDERASEGIDTVVSDFDCTLSANIENLRLSRMEVAYDLSGEYGSEYAVYDVVEADAARLGQGNALGNSITGNDADNRLLGMDGDDVLAGSWGEDVMIGGRGADRFVLTDGGDTLRGGNGGGAFDAAGRAVGDVIDLTGLGADLAWGGTARTGEGFVWVENAGADTVLHAGAAGLGDFTLRIEDGTVRASDYGASDVLL